MTRQPLTSHSYNLATEHSFNAADTDGRHRSLEPTASKCIDSSNSYGCEQQDSETESTIKSRDENSYGRQESATKSIARNSNSYNQEDISGDVGRRSSKVMEHENVSNSYYSANDDSPRSVSMVSDKLQRSISSDSNSYRDNASMTTTQVVDGDESVVMVSSDDDNAVTIGGSRRKRARETPARLVQLPDLKKTPVMSVRKEQLVFSPRPDQPLVSVQTDTEGKKLVL